MTNALETSIGSSRAGHGAAASDAQLRHAEAAWFTTTR